MAIKKVVTIEVDNDDAVKNLKAQEKATEATADAIEDLNEETDKQDKSNKKASKTSKVLEKLIKKLGATASAAGKKGAKGFKALSGGLNLVGTALKATGIGAVFALLFRVFSENQVVLDAVNKAMNFTQQIVLKLTPPVIALKDALVDTFSAIKNVGIGVFKRLTGDAEGASEAFGKAGEKFKEAGSGFVDAAKKTADAVGDITSNAGEMWELADAMEEQRKKMELVQIQNDILQKQYMREAEIQRQLRDDVSASITERIAANEELSRVLEKSLNERLGLAQQELAFLEKQLALQPDNVEYQQAVLEAKYRIADIEEEIVGFQSEQLINSQDLEKQTAEYQDLLKSGALEAKALELDALAAAETNVGRRIELEQQAADIRYQGQLEALQGQLEFFDEESVEYQALMNEKLSVDATYQAEKEQRQRDAYDAEIARQQSLLDHELAMEELKLTNSQRATNDAWSSFYQQEAIATLQMENAQKRLEEQLENDRLTADERKKIEDKLSAHKDSIRKYEEEQEAKKKDMMVGMAFGMAKDIGAIAGAGANFQKAVGVAQATFDTYRAISGVLAATDVPTVAKPFIAAAYGAKGLAQVKGILSTPVPASPFGGGGGRGATPSAPQVSLATTSGAQAATINSAQASAAEGDAPPQKVYVVSSDIENAQQLERKIDSQSSIG